MVSDPRCPACDGPVGTTSSYCMHCGAEFDSPTGLGGTDSETQKPVETTTEASTPSDGATSAALTGWEARLDAWLAPDGWLDNSLTVVVAVVAGLFVGPLTGMFLGIVTGSAWSLAVGLLAWLGSTAYLARKQTVYGAVHDGFLGVAALFVVLPFGFLAVADGSTADRLGGFLAFEVVLGLFALPLVVVGKLAGRLRAKKDE